MRWPLHGWLPWHAIIPINVHKQVLFTTLRIVFKVIEKVLDEMSTVIDLRLFWIPSAFLSLAFEKQKIQNMRIVSLRVRFTCGISVLYLSVDLSSRNHPVGSCAYPFLKDGRLHNH